MTPCQNGNTGVSESEEAAMRRHDQITLEQARRVGDSLYLDWEQVDIEQFRQGLMGFSRSDSDYRGLFLAGKTVLAHMQQFPDYIIRLARLRAEARVLPAGTKRSTQRGTFTASRPPQR